MDLDSCISAVKCYNLTYILFSVTTLIVFMSDGAASDAM